MNDEKNRKRSDTLTFYNNIKKIVYRTFLMEINLLKLIQFVKFPYG